MFIRLLSTCKTARLGESLASNFQRHITCVPLNDRSCGARSTPIYIYDNETLFYPFTVSVNKCGGICIIIIQVE